MIAAAILLALAAPAAAACPTTRSNALDADKIARVVPSHRALRQEFGVAMPDALMRVLIYSDGGHLQTTRISIVATRDATGRWHTDAVGNSSGWTMNVPPSDMPHLARVLSVADGRSIDALLRDPAFWRETEPV